MFSPSEKRMTSNSYSETHWEDYRCCSSSGEFHCKSKPAFFRIDTLHEGDEIRSLIPIILHAPLLSSPRKEKTAQCLCSPIPSYHCTCCTNLKASCSPRCFFLHCDRNNTHRRAQGILLVSYKITWDNNF